MIVPTINNGTLCVAIASVAARIREFEALMATEGEDDAADTADILLQYDLAAEELRRAYDEQARTVINLTPYDELIAG